MSDPTALYTKDSFKVYDKQIITNRIDMGEFMPSEHDWRWVFNIAGRFGGQRKDLVCGEYGYDSLVKLFFRTIDRPQGSMLKTLTCDLDIIEAKWMDKDKALIGDPTQNVVANEKAFVLITGIGTKEFKP